MKHKNSILDYVLIVLGAAIYATSINLFIRPLAIPLGGVNGLALLVNAFTRFPVGVFSMLVNIPLFLLGMRRMGRRFLTRTLTAVVVSSIALDLPYTLPVLTSDLILSSLYGGVLMGLGLGLVFARGGTTGGVDILSKLLHMRYETLSIGRFSLVMSGTIILISALCYGRIELALYALIAQYASNTVLDALLSGMEHTSAALIITERPDEVSKALLLQLGRGVTGLSGEGMYTKKSCTTLLCAARSHEILYLKNLVSTTDPSAFVILLNAREVMGQGFKRYGSS